MIPRSKIEEVLNVARIEEVIGEFVNLKKSGRSFKALSPFSNEKTPSFMVSPEKQIFKDFSSGKGGNVISFIMEHEHFSYPEAIRWLAKRYNIEIEEEEFTPEQKEQESERESLFIVTAFAEGFFHEQLHETDEGKSVGLSYFRERGFSEDTIEKFRLGYSPDSWDDFLTRSKEKGYKMEFLEKAGLVKKSSKGEGQFYDGYKGRVIFPIQNLSGRPIGFGGRILTNEKKAPKYINSPDSLIYNKSEVLYGLYFAKGEIIKADNCYLVEGYTDVISFHQSGIANTVASSGTALTPGQVRLIKRYTENITVLYDGDEAGIKASFRGIDLILKEGMNVKMVSFPDGEDPDSFAQKNDTEDIRSFLQNGAKDFIVSKTEILLNEAGNDPIQRAKLVKEIVGSIALIPEAITRSIYIRECSLLLEVEERILILELNKVRRKAFNQEQNRRLREQEQEPEFGVYPPTSIPLENRKSPTIEDELAQLERDILRIIINYGDKEFTIKSEGKDLSVKVAPFMINDLLRDEMLFKNQIYSHILSEVHSLIQDSEQIDFKHFTHHEDDKIRSTAVDMLTDRYQLHNWWDERQIHVASEEEKLERAVRGSLYSYKSKRVVEWIKKTQEELKQAQDNQNDEQILALLKRQQNLDNIKAQLSNSIGRIILT